MSQALGFSLHFFFLILLCLHVYCLVNSRFFLQFVLVFFVTYLGNSMIQVHPELETGIPFRVVRPEASFSHLLGICQDGLCLCFCSM